MIQPQYKTVIEMVLLKDNSVKDNEIVEDSLI